MREEDGILSVCVYMEARIERDVEVTLFTGSGSATGIIATCHDLSLASFNSLFTHLLILCLAPDDYSAINVSVVFIPDALSNRTMCESVAIHSDSVLEETEVFSVTLAISDSDPAVVIPPGGASTLNVTVWDSTGKSKADTYMPTRKVLISFAREIRHGSSMKKSL